MAKIAEDAAQGLPLNDERIAPRKLNRHVVVALNNLNKRRDVLLAAQRKTERELSEIDGAILALEGKE